jgi:branched-chain amino acid transport system substrate-binding protein
MKIKIILGIIIVILIILVAAFYKPVPKETIKIGAILPLTGSNSIYGDLSKKGVDIAVEEINKKGINGKKLEIVYQDSESKAETAVQVFNSLRNIQNINIFLTEVSSVALAISPLANENKVIQMDVGATTPKYTSKDDYTFRTAINSQYFAEAMSRKLLEIGIDNIGVLYINNDWGVGYKEKFEKNFNKENIVIEQSFEPNATDFRTQLTKIKAKNPEAILLISQLKETPRLLKQTTELNIKIPIYSDVYSIESKDVIDSAGSAAEGIIYIAPKFDTERTDSVFVNYKDKYFEKFKEIPESLSAQAYDAVKVLAQALKKCGNDVDTDCIKNELYKIQDFDGVSGKITFDEYGEVEDKPVQLKQIKNGQFVPYEE